MTKLLQIPWARSVLALGFVIVLGCAFPAHGAFYHWNTHRDMLRQVSVYGILACGLTPVIVTGGIDLSVGSVLGLCAVGFAQLSLAHHTAAVIAIPVTLALGTALGVT